MLPWDCGVAGASMLHLQAEIQAFEAPACLNQHPEPPYPSWTEILVQQDFLCSMPSQITRHSDKLFTWFSSLSYPTIPVHRLWYSRALSVLLPERSPGIWSPHSLGLAAWASPPFVDIGGKTLQLKGVHFSFFMSNWSQITTIYPSLSINADSPKRCCKISN